MGKRPWLVDGSVKQNVHISLVGTLRNKNPFGEDLLFSHVSPLIFLHAVKTMRMLSEIATRKTIVSATTKTACQGGPRLRLDSSKTVKVVRVVVLFWNTAIPLQLSIFLYLQVK